MNSRLRFVTLYRRQGSRPPPWKRNAKKQWPSGEALQIAVKRREAKSKGEKEELVVSKNITCWNRGFLSRRVTKKGK